MGWPSQTADSAQLWVWRVCLVRRYCDIPAVVEARVVHVILTVMRVPMARKYGCPAL